MAMDQFAGIAAKGIGGNAALLCDPMPAPHTPAPCPLCFEEATSLAPVPDLTDAGQLKEALCALKKNMAPFLRDLSAPPQPRRRTALRDFTLDGKEITLPHYGAPVGAATQTYKTTFSYHKTPGKLQYLCLEGVDYIAQVLLNGSFVLCHEGFFAAFEGEITNQLRNGENELVIIVKNDYIFQGNDNDQGGSFAGDKLYAATGLGWDDPKMGWHHCPPGMGIWGEVAVEERPRIFVNDVFVRPLPQSAEAEICAEIYSDDYAGRQITLWYTVEPKNFEGDPVASGAYTPKTSLYVGRGDSLTESALAGSLGSEIPLLCRHGINVYTFRVPMGEFRTWAQSAPYLYAARVRVEEEGVDERRTVFGMRTFTQDTEHEPKGMFYLNGTPLRLRGANTMGFEQQDVLRGDFEQLIDDILLAKLCNMNFLRLTQRPVQQAVYEHCDMLGLLVQTDLPLFGVMRRTKVPEGIRQAEEMERHIRSHPSAVLISYVNEPFPNANNEPHRHLRREELLEFFKACDIVVHLQNPDRVIKHIDGDYDPPCESMPDNHCYPMWYNGHGIDIGRLNKGEWLSVKPGWYYGCGEFGSEGLDSEQVMTKYYPKEWLCEPFDPNNIVRAQTGLFYGMFYDAQDTRAAWVAQSQRYQALATKLMTEAFRRDDRMATFAIHLFIDAFPSGWMKTIMDCDRIPKEAYFAYRHALSPVLLSLRSDRFAYYCGEQVHIESYLCNDTCREDTCRIRYELYEDGKCIGACEQAAALQKNKAAYAGECVFPAPQVADRAHYMLRAVLLTEDGEALNENSFEFDVFCHVAIPQNPKVTLLTGLSAGEHTVAGHTVHVKNCAMLPVHFVSRRTGHKAVQGFAPKDFRFFYDAKLDRIAPLCDRTFTAEGAKPILLSCNTDENGNWGPAFAAAEFEENGQRTVVCTVDLRLENPVAERFLAAIMAE